MAHDPSERALAYRVVLAIEESVRLRREMQDSIATMTDLVRQRHILSSHLKLASEETRQLLRVWPPL